MHEYYSSQYEVFFTMDRRFHRALRSRKLLRRGNGGKEWVGRGWGWGMRLGLGSGRGEGVDEAGGKF